jgi:hypothetical protein
MTRAQQLVVGWMAATACLAALQVWRRPPPRRAAKGAPALALAMREAPTNAIERYLRGRYDEIERRDTGAVVEAGLAYAGAPLIELHEDRLRWLMPDTRFFKTRLRTGRSYDPEIGVLVSIKRTREGDDIRSCVGPVEGDPSPKFLGQFIGVAAPGEARNGIAHAIAELIAATADDGRAVPLGIDDVGRAAIWSGATHWRDIEVTTDHTGTVSQIVAVRPGTFILDTIVH